jgi:Zn-dependent protease
MIAQYIANAIALLVAIDVHEFCHAWMADRLGDPTPRYQGRLTLNPLAHLDPLGTLMLILVRFGWGKPVPVNPYNLRNGPKSGMAMVSFAGPLANLIAAALLALPVRLGLVMPTLRGGIIPSPEMVVTTTILVNVSLAVFNLIPVAPLDGFKVAIGLLPYRWSHALAQFERYGPLLLIFLILPGFWGASILFVIMEPVIRFLWVLLTGRPLFFM